MYYVYLLQSINDNKFYTGITNNINRRLDQHNSGSNISTKSRGPFNLIFAQECDNRIEARKLEVFLKSGVGRELRDKLLK